MPTGSNNPLGKVRPGYVKDQLTVIRQATDEDMETYPVKRSKSETLIRWWVVECSCGETCIMSTTRLNGKNLKSCGCKRWRGFCRGVTDRNDPVDMVRRNCFTSMKSKAKERGLAWEITYTDFKRMTQCPCIYCGAPPSNSARPTAHHMRTGPDPQPWIYSGFDRVDTKQGYIYGNVAPCCKRCNVAKSDMTALEFYQWINRFRTRANIGNCLDEIDTRFNWDNCAATSG